MAPSEQTARQAFGEVARLMTVYPLRWRLEDSPMSERGAAGMIGDLPLSISYDEVAIRPQFFDSRVSIDARWPPASQLRVGEFEGTATVFTCLEMVDLRHETSKVIVLQWAGSARPIVRFQDDRPGIWVSAGRDIAHYDVGLRALSCSARLEWSIDELIPAGSDLVVMCDRGLVRLSPECGIVWSLATDGLIQDWRAAGDALEVDVDGSAPLRVKL